MASEVIATYDFDEDAMGLGAFVERTIADLPDSEIHVDVFDDQGRIAESAAFVRTTATDGSAFVQLTITFDRRIA